MSFLLLFSLLLLLHLLPDLLLHLDAIVSMSSPVCLLTPFVTVASLKNYVMSQDLHYKDLNKVTFLHPAHLLFSRFVTSLWQNQQILSTLSLPLPWVVGSTTTMLCLDFLPSFRICLILLCCSWLGKYLRGKIDYNEPQKTSSPYHVVDCLPVVVFQIKVNAWMVDQHLEGLKDLFGLSILL